MGRNCLILRPFRFLSTHPGIRVRNVVRAVSVALIPKITDRRIDRPWFVGPDRAEKWTWQNPRPLSAMLACDKARAASWMETAKRLPNVCPESQVESCKHQNNADIYHQPFPESVSEERQIYTDYNGCHRQRVKHDSYLSAHFSTLRLSRFSALVRLSALTAPTSITSGRARRGSLDQHWASPSRRATTA